MLEFKQNDTSATLILTLTESITLVSPNYLFVFKHVTTKDIVAFVVTNGGDLSPSKVRYNQFAVNPSVLFAGYPTGEWHYGVYEQSSTTNLDPTLAYPLDFGQLLLDRAVDFSYQVYNGEPHIKSIMDKKDKFEEPQIAVVNFAGSVIPTFSESKLKDYISFGEDNEYPLYLTELFNTSAKHNAIVVGKSKYIFGDGFLNGDIKVNRLQESLNDISPRAILDICLYGGFRLEVIWNRFGRIQDIYHIDFSTLRNAKDGGYFFHNNWGKYAKTSEATYLPAFDPSNPVGSQVFAYNEYRPMAKYYPLPDYIGCLNYIEVDIEIGKFNLSGIRNGMNPSKIIQFFKGEPTEDKKREIERRMAKKFAGSDNAGKFLLVFNDTNATKSVEINDLSGSDLDKMYSQLNLTCQQEIFSGHGVTSPMLFGIKTEGQLGGSTELNISYSIFQNTYSKPKAISFSKEIEYLLSFSEYPGQYDLLPSDPIGLQFDVKDVINSLPKAFVFQKLGIPEDQWDLVNIGSDNRPTPTVPVSPSTIIDNPNPKTGLSTGTELAVNENIKNLSAKQHQQLMRIVRQYGKGQLTELAAKALLRTSLGLSDTDINSLLGIQAPLQMSAQDEDDHIIQMFDSCGDNDTDFEIIKSKTVSFSSELEMQHDEEIYVKEAFKTYDVTITEERILELIRKDKRITSQVIADTIGQSVSYIESRLADLTRRGYLETSTDTIGADIIVERIVPQADIIGPPPVKGTPNPVAVYVKYSYEGPYDKKNRPFCRRLLDLHRLYSRAEIEQISARLGYSVFDRRGGFWTRKGTNVTTPYCRHKWKSNIVVKRDK